MNKNSQYWSDRFVDLENSLNSYGQDTFRQIEPIFYNAQKDIQKQIEVWIFRIAKNNQISMQEAKKLLDKNELAELKWDVSEYIKYGYENSVNGAWVKELENASAKYHISRLESLKIRTQQALEVAFGNELDNIDIMSRKVYSDSYYHTAFELQKGFSIGWDIASIDERKLEKIISKPWASDGKNFSNRIWQSKTLMINDLHKELARTCILGKAPDEAIKHMAKFVDKKFSNAKNQAGRLVMTEQAFFASAAQKEAFNDLDVKEYEIVATLDSHTSEICKAMDGKHFLMKEYQPGVTAPPFHVWCRSCTVPYFDDEWSTGERAAKGEDGKTYYVPDTMKYGDWFDKYVKTNKEALTKIKMDKNISSDKLQYEKYKAIYSEDFPNSFAKFQYLKYNNSDEWEIIKAKKQRILNSKSYEEIQGLKGQLGNLETRLWYKAQDENIPNIINKNKNLKHQAQQASELRCRYRTQARDLMKDQETRKQLDLKYPNLPFEYYVKKYSKPNETGKKPSMDEVYTKIIKKSTTSNKAFDKKAGVKDEI